MSTQILTQSKSDESYESEIVAYVYQRFHPKKEYVKPSQVSPSIVNKVEEFLHRHRLWVYCRKVMGLMKSRGLDRSYLETREEIIQKLIRYKKNNKEALEEQTRQMRHIEKVIEKCEERGEHYGRELERYKEQADEASNESIERLELRQKEFEEEITFREHVLEVQKELAANKFSEMTDMEKELCDLEHNMDVMILDAKNQALRFQIPESIALTLFNYIVNDGYFTYVPEEEWEHLMANSSSKEQTILKGHFHYDRAQLAYLLNDEQRYISPIQRKLLVGSATSSGISFLDFHVKKILSDKLNSLSFHSYLNETKSFYAYLVQEALVDGVLTVDEMNMLDEIAVVLKMDMSMAKNILNTEAQKIQKNFINEQMMVFYDLAMADGVMQRDEAKFLVEMNDKFDAQVIHKISVTMEHRKAPLKLNLDTEELFVDMCRMVMKDGVLDNKESEMLMNYIKKHGWEKAKLQPMLAKAMSSQN